MIKSLKKISNDKRGALLIVSLIFGSIATMVLISAASTYALFEHRASVQRRSDDMSFHIAEAGINYYRWHLAHAPEDYTDGTGEPGPYYHEYKDKNGDVIGYFMLEIDPPLPGSTIVTVRSTGYTIWQPETTRTVQVRLGFPSVTDFAFVENANMSFSATTIVHGPVHSNGGIRFEGETNSTVQSAKETYDYYGETKPGIWGGGGPQEFWEFPVAPKDFEGVTADLADIRDLAIEGGVTLPPSGDEGWHLVFKDDGTFDKYRVTQTDCYLGSGYWERIGWWWYWIDETHCYDVGAETFIENLDLPENGALYADDHVWVEGVVNGRVTVGAGRFPVSEENYREIYIQDNLTLNEKGADDVIGLMAQGNIIVPYYVPNDMVIETAALSQYKMLYRPYYRSSGQSRAIRNSLTFFGSQISNEGGGWKYVSGSTVVSGFIYTYHIYDANLRFFPAPEFPVENSYELISWEEI